MMKISDIRNKDSLKQMGEHLFKISEKKNTQRVEIKRMIEDCN
jgi:hypothetical protein